MSKRFRAFIEKAFTCRRAATAKPNGEFNLRDYMPPFSQQDHATARRNGYRDAQEQWLWESKGKLGAHAEIERRKRAKLETLLAMESDGVPMEDLGDLAGKANRLPAWSDFSGPPAVRIPDNPEVRKVKVAGIVNRYIALLEKMDKRGLDLQTSEDDVQYEDKRFLLYARHERDEIARRLEACGEDIETVHEGIRTGAVRRVDRIRVIVPSDDPLIRRIQEDEEAAMGESADEDGGEQENTLAVVVEANTRIPGKSAQDHAAGARREDGEETESEETDDAAADEPDEEDHDEQTPESENAWDTGWSDPWS